MVSPSTPPSSTTLPQVDHALTCPGCRSDFLRPQPGIVARPSSLTLVCPSCAAMFALQQVVRP